MSKGSLFILSAPSGCGKTTLLRQVMADLPRLAFSVSHTTRQPRAGELDGREYHFVERSRFVTLRDRESGFLEWAEVHGNLYGTSRDEVESRLARGVDVVLDIDVQGARQVKAQMPEAISVFIAPPSLEELETRLRGRGTEQEETIALRLRNAREELDAMDSYDYVIVNERLEEAVRSLTAIFLAERSRKRRTPTGSDMPLFGKGIANA